MTLDPDEEDLLGRVESHLAEVGPRILTDLADDLGVDPDELDDLLMMTDNSCMFVDGDRWYNVGAHLVGATVTHRIDEQDLATGGLAATPDLWLLLCHDPSDWPLATGGALRLEGLGPREETRFHGPDGWLDGLAVGDLVVLNWAGDAVHIDRIDAADAPDEDPLAARILDTFAAVRERSGSQPEPMGLGYELLADNADALRELRPPLTETLEALGLFVEGEHLFERGDDPKALWRSRVRERLVDDYPWLEAEAADGAAAVVAALSPREPEPDLHRAEELNAWLAEEAVVSIVALDRLGTRPWDVAEVATRLDAVGALLGDEQLTAGVWWLRSRIAEHDRDAAVLREHIEAALRVDPDFGPALEDRADLREEAGDAPGALRLLRRAGVRDDDPQVQRLEFYGQPGPATAGRNEPCGCGSGRKHKVCCGPTRGWPLRQRLDWLLQRLATFAHRPAQRLPIVELAQVFSFDEDSERHLQAIGDPLILSLAVLDGGIVASYLDLRGDLLRDDEREVVRGWCDVRLDAYEVTAIDGARSRLTSVRSGDALEVDDASMAEHAEPGMTVSTWLLPYPDGHLMEYAAMPVSELFLDDLIEVIEQGEPIGIAAFFEGQDHLYRLVEEHHER